ncbi:hypothetical protein NUW54_g8043 [Trametes sanguinea]|uniref:Uncharacterized protein n=1 Tax=Trametes sanguinea TaxID=158606 RepID=A0ACC1PIM6_9APHY|nr:hypothetical protein NUW54_g8043 [Trametes sanguinea]
MPADVDYLKGLLRAFPDYPKKVRVREGHISQANLLMVSSAGHRLLGHLPPPPRPDRVRDAHHALCAPHNLAHDCAVAEQED